MQRTTRFLAASLATLSFALAAQAQDAQPAEEAPSVEPQPTEAPVEPDTAEGSEPGGPPEAVEESGATAEEATPGEQGASDDAEGSEGEAPEASDGQAPSEPGATSEASETDAPSDADAASAPAPAATSAASTAQTPNVQPAENPDAAESSQHQVVVVGKVPKPRGPTPAEAEARERRWRHSPAMEEGWATLSLGSQGFIRPQSDYDLFSEANYFSAPMIALGADAWRPNARWALAVEGSLAFELVRSKDVREGSLDTRYKAWHPRLAALLRYRVRPWLAPYVRVGGGVSVVGVQIRGEVPGPNEVLLDEPNVSFGVDLGLGVEVRTGSLGRADWALPRLSLGLRVEVGASLGPAIDIEPTRQGTGSAAIDTQNASLGRLDRNAPYLLISGVVRM